MLLTLSIGLVSVNSPLSSAANAQNSAISQKGNGDSEQDTKQLQSSDQNGQIVSGESSILSGNNLVCQDQDNSDGSLGLCPEGLTSPSLEIRTVRLHTVLFADCFPIGPPCPSPDGIITSNIFVSSYAPRTNQPGGMTDVYVDMPVGLHFSFQARGGDGGPYFTFDRAEFVGDCSGRNSCNGVVGPDGANVGVNFYYKLNSE